MDQQYQTIILIPVIGVVVGLCKYMIDKISKLVEKMDNGMQTHIHRIDERLANIEDNSREHDIHLASILEVLRESNAQTERSNNIQEKTSQILEIMTAQSKVRDETTKQMLDRIDK